ncbi:MAG: M23 family metallopeptidase [Candidatus Krumholzibacteriota bacterium]|nr:M23 family metallopeptidase [Candidatus Krumholzibacteriota bacterium]
MKRRKAIVCAIILLFASTAAAEVYLWPFHGSRRLSSSFSEFRSGHFHAGIDLRSFGAIGLPCLAISDGCASRVRISHSGYGKALYMRLSDGNTAVYAHLDGFSASLDSFLWYYRKGKGVSWCDLTLDGGRFCFDVGDTLCWSGETGTTAPHLHFELRDSSQRPLNPLEGFYHLPDETAPMISGLEVIPRGEGSIVDGSRFPRFYLFRASGRENYELADTLHLDGSFSFAVSTWDEQGFSRYHMAPYDIEILIDGAPLYHIRNSIFSYAQSGEVDLEYDIVGKGSSQRYTLLYRKEGVSRPDRTGQGIIDSSANGKNGVIILERGIHRGEISIIDASGNRSEGIFFFSIHDHPVITEARVLEAAPEAIVSAVDPDGGEVTGRLFESIDGGNEYSAVPLTPFGIFLKGDLSGTVDAIYRYEAIDDEGARAVEFFGTPVTRGERDSTFCEADIRAVEDGVVIDITTDRIAKSDLSVTRPAEGSLRKIEVIRTGPLTFSAIARNKELKNGLNIFRIEGFDHRGFPLIRTEAFRIYLLRSQSEANIVISDTLEASLRGQAVSAEAAVVVNAARFPGSIPEGLKPVTSAFSIDFCEESFRRPMKLVCDTGRKTALFLWEEDEGWSCVGVPAMEGGSVDIPESGIYIFLYDGLPPVIRHAALEERYAGSGFFKPYICYLPVDETGSGIDPWSAETYLDGERVVCEWDEFRKRLYMPVPAFLPPEYVKLRAEISDRSGNRTVEEFGFMLK